MSGKEKILFKMLLIKEKKLKLNFLHNVFQKSMTYSNSMLWKQVVDFNSTQFNDIEPSIEKTLDYMDTYRFNNERTYSFINVRIL